MRMGIFMTKNEQSNPAAEKAQDNKGNIYKNKSGILFSTKTESSMRERKAKERRRKKKKTLMHQQKTLLSVNCGADEHVY